MGFKRNSTNFFSLKMWRLGLILSFVTVALALFPGGRFLEDKPDPNLCAQSKLLASGYK